MNLRNIFLSFVCLVPLALYGQQTLKIKRGTKLSESEISVESLNQGETSVRIKTDKGLFKKAAFSGDNKYVATLLWDVEVDTETKRATKDETSLEIYDLTGKKVRAIPGIIQYSWSGKGGKIAYINKADKVIKTLDVNTGSTTSFGTPKSIHKIKFVNNDLYYQCGHEIYKVKSGSGTPALTEYKSMNFSSTGEFYAYDAAQSMGDGYCTYDPTGNRFCFFVYDTKTNQEVALDADLSKVSPSKWLDGSNFYLMTSRDLTYIEIWDVKANKMVKKIEGKETVEKINKVHTNDLFGVVMKPDNVNKL